MPSCPIDNNTINYKLHKRSKLVTFEMAKMVGRRHLAILSNTKKNLFNRKWQKWSCVGKMPFSLFKFVEVRMAKMVERQNSVILDEIKKRT